MNFGLCVLLGLLHGTWTHIKIKNSVLLGKKKKKNWCSALEVCEMVSWKFKPCFLCLYHEDIFATAVTEALWKRENRIQEYSSQILVWHSQVSPGMEAPQLPNSFEAICKPVHICLDGFLHSFLLQNWLSFTCDSAQCSETSLLKCYVTTFWPSHIWAPAYPHYPPLNIPE